MEEHQLSREESLRIIQQMIGEAKREQKDNGIGWIIWGWMLFMASVLSFVNTKTTWFSQYFFWNIFGMITLLMLVVEIVRFLFIRRQPKVKTYTSDLFNRLNIGFFISIMIIIVAMNLRVVMPTTGFCLLLGLYGFWILIYGTIFSFKPSIIGSYITSACGLGGLFVQDYQYVMLIHAAGVMAGYIIPGHLAMIEFRKTNRKAVNV